MKTKKNNNENIRKALMSQFYRGNKFNLIVASAAGILSNTINLAITWIMKELIDTASGVGGSYSL
ncbi:MAG: hypothetical protein Q4E07_06415 [Eubacteriales bacterium]|nr:hypothetical protein [Eubacteriales bacterium]